MKGCNFMEKNYFTDEQVEFLRKNKYVKHVSNKGITYSLEFKELCIKEYGLKNTTKIFEDGGLQCLLLNDAWMNCNVNMFNYYGEIPYLKLTLMKF